MNDRAEVISIHAGNVREYADDQGRPWRSAIAKSALSGPVFLGQLGLAGDQVGDPRHHGGLHQAVLAYPAEHYRFWQEELGLDAGPGGFGENLALMGLTEEEVCIGDVFELGEALVQVSQPRQPCHTLARRWTCPELINVVWQTARGGWYLRVLREGMVEAGQTLLRVQRPHPGWTVARVLWASQGTTAAEGSALAALEHLSLNWKEKFGGLG